MLDRLKNEFKILNEIISNADTEDINLICKILGGHHLNTDEACFDLNFGSACYTIHKYGGKYEINESIEYYPDSNSPIVQYITKYDLIEEQKLSNKHLTEALEQFNKVAFKLLVALQGVDLDKFPKSMRLYPFHDEFKPMYDGIFEWVSAIINEIKEPPAPSLFKILAQIQAKDPNAYIEVVGVNGRFKDVIGLASPTTDGMVQLWIGDDYGEDDCKISPEQFNNEFKIYSINWSDEDAI